MSSAVTSVWENFFRGCDLPSSVSKAYAAAFVKERIQPYLLKELGKDELRELGVQALGDQLAILRYVKQTGGSPPEFKAAGKPRNIAAKEDMLVDDDDGDLEEDVEYISSSSASKAPDRTEIYHIRMPEGRTPRAREILQKHAALREQGLIKRGTSGIRQSGINIHKPQLKVSGQSRMIRKKPLMIQDVSSTSRMRSDRLMAEQAAEAAAISTRVPQRARAAAVAAQRANPPVTDFRIRINMDEPPSRVAQAAQFNRHVAAAATGRTAVVRAPITERIQRVGAQRAVVGAQQRGAGRAAITGTQRLGGRVTIAAAAPAPKPNIMQRIRLSGGAPRGGVRVVRKAFLDR